MKELFVGLDIGGTKLAAGIGTGQDELSGEASTPTPRLLRPQEVVESLAELANLALRKADAIWKEVKGVGISFGGPVDFNRGITVACHHLPGWNRVPLAKVIKNRLNLPVIMDNDANAGALGEARFGAGRKVEDLFYITVSSGIGGGLIIGKRIYRGTFTLAGEIGHTIFRTEGPLCTCGRKGCLEALASGWSIVRNAKEALAKTEEKSLLRGLSEKSFDAKAVAEAAKKGDAIALEVINNAADALGQGIAAVANILNLPLVVIGGGVAKAGNTLFRPLREAVQNYAMPEIGETVKVVPSELGDRAPLLGAIALAAEEAG
jgi:glucokinase